MRVQSDHNIPRVLLVDDEEIIHIAIKKAAARLNVTMDFHDAEDAEEAVALINSTCFDAAVIDVRLPGVSGMSFGAEIREYDVNLPVAYLTHLDTMAVRAEAMAQRAFFLTKARFIDTPEGLTDLIGIIGELAKLNPCLDGGARIDNAGHLRRYERSPFRLPEVYQVLIDHNRAISLPRGFASGI